MGWIGGWNAFVVKDPFLSEKLRGGASTNVTQHTPGLSRSSACYQGVCSTVCRTQTPHFAGCRQGQGARQPPTVTQTMSDSSRRRGSRQKAGARRCCLPLHFKLRAWTGEDSSLSPHPLKRPCLRNPPHNSSRSAACLARLRAPSSWTRTRRTPTIQGMNESRARRSTSQPQDSLTSSPLIEGARADSPSSSAST